MSRTITLADGTKISYHTYHPDAPRTMVLIHGITGNHKGFQYILPELENVRCIVPDLPGFGESDLPPKAFWSVDGIAELANQFVAALDLDTPPVILGHSMGGLVVSSMVNQRPDLYAPQVILISPVPTPVRRFDSRALGAKLGSVQYALGDHLSKNRAISRAATRVMVKTTDRERRKAIYLHHLDNLNYFSDSKFYRALHTDINARGSVDYARALRAKSILLIAGDIDAVTPLREMNTLASTIHPAEYIVIPSVGHLIHYEKAAEAASAITEFLQR